MMENNPNLVPSFFKVLIGGFATKLPIPPAFVTKLSPCVPKNATLKARRGKSEWVVKIELFDGKFYFSGQGWQRFARDNNLKNGNFVVFRLICNRVFEFVVYDLNACEKVMVTPEFCDGRTKSVNDVYFILKDEKTLAAQCGRSLGDNSKKKLSFSIVFNKFNRCYLAIPKAFVYEAGIESKKFVIMRNKQLGKVWRVDICWMAYKNNSRYRMATKTGWHDFCNDNSLSLKDRCLFKFVAGSDNIIDVEIYAK